MIRITAILGILAASIICFTFGTNNSATESTSAPTGTGQSPSPLTTSSSDHGLFDELRALDAALFQAAFDTCDLPALTNLISSDFEFLHDRGGLVATNGAQFLDNVRNQCERRRTGQDSRSRRELVPGSLEVYPLANYGAIQTGVHRFYILEPGKPERPGDIAKFTHVWKKSGSQWQLARVLSYDHKLAP